MQQIRSNRHPHRCALRQLYLEEGHTIGDIARLLRVRKQTICTALAQLDIPRRRRGPKRMVPVVARSTRQALRTIAAALGVPKTTRLLKTSPKTLHALLDDKVIPRGTPHKVDDTLVRAAYEEGLPIAVIAAKFACSERTIRNSLQRTEPIGTEIRPV